MHRISDKSQVQTFVKVHSYALREEGVSKQEALDRAHERCFALTPYGKRYAVRQMQRNEEEFALPRTPKKIKDILRYTCGKLRKR